jgi:hypothetical protein
MVRVVFDDSVTKLLKDFAADKGVVSRVVGAVAFRMKEHIREANERTFPSKSGKYKQSIWYKQRRGAVTATLRSGNLTNIYERKGALIQPMSGQALKFEINGKTIFYKGVIRIPPRPWFDVAVSQAQGRGIDNQAALTQIEWEIMEKNLG